MKKEQENLFLDLLRQKQKISVEECSRILHISEATVRRMFVRLASQNLIKRCRGVACMPDQDDEHGLPFFKREQWYSNVKRKLIQKVLEFIPPHGIVSVHGGSTTVLLAMLLDHGTIVTNSWVFCEILNRRFPTGGGPELILTGGRLDYRHSCFLGSAAEQTMARYYTDVGIFSCSALDEEGTYDYDDEGAAMQKIIAGHAKTKIAIADHSKFSGRSMCRSLYWNEIDILITDYAPENNEILNAIRSQGVQVIILPSCNDEYVTNT